MTGFSLTLMTRTQKLIVKLFCLLDIWRGVGEGMGEGMAWRTLVFRSGEDN